VAATTTIAATAIITRARLPGIVNLYGREIGDSTAD